MNTATKAKPLPETITEDGEILTAPLSFAETKSMAVSLARAEIDMQITTAHAFPRSIDRAVKNIQSLATLDQQTAAECIYALPRGGKPIRGPSVRFAEIIMNSWGNCRAGARVVHVDRHERYVEAEGVFHDLENSAATTARVRRRISDKNGVVFNEDMIVVTGNAACAIARRNAILAGVPKAAWRSSYDAVEKVIAGDVVTIAQNREIAIKAFAVYGVKPEQVFAALEVAGEADIGLEQIITMRGMFSAIKNGEATVEEMFPPKPASIGAGAAQRDLAGKLDELAKNGNGSRSEPSKGEEASSPGAASPENSPQGAGHARAAEEAASDQQPARTQPTPEPSGAADVPAWPAGQVPANEVDYRQFARAWFAKVKDGRIKPEDAQLQWKADRQVRNKANVTEEVRDELKAELDGILAGFAKG